MASEWIKARQTRYGAYVTLYCIVILCVIFAANYLAKDHNKSIDVTSNKRFTLSDQTKKVVGELKKEVQVYYFDRSENYERARDMLDRYQNLSGKLHVNYVDPEKKPDVARLEGVRAMGDIVVDNGVKKETAKGLTEEEITGAIIRTLKSGARNVCFVKGSGEHSIDDTGRDGYSGIKALLEKNNYKTQSVSLLEKPEIPKECNIVVAGGPKRDYIQPEVDAIRNFVQGGGGAVLNFDAAIDLPDGKMGDTPALAALASSWGVTPNGDVIVDLGAASQILGPMNPIVTSYESHPIVHVLEGSYTILPASRSLDVKAPAEKLFSTSAESFSLVNPKPPITIDPKTAKQGPFVAGAAATIGSGAGAGHVVVVGSSDWMSNRSMSRQFANTDLLMNVMNWMTSDQDLISIRPKDPEDRRLRITGKGTVTIFWISVISIPMIVIASGVSVWWKRR